MRLPILTSLTDAALQNFPPSRRRARLTGRPRSIGVVVSTYNNPTWLEKTLWGYLNQRFDRFPLEFLIADDGSGDETGALLDHVRAESGANIKRIWIPDDGFQKCRVLNLAVEAAESEYLIFTDQDCVARPDLVETHYRAAQRGWFVSGGYVKLPLELSRALTREDVETGRCFSLRWLRERGLKIRPFSALKLVKSPFLAALLNWTTPTLASWNGCCSSCWKDDFYKVNGFNEKMRYGGLDREFGERLANLGVRGKQLRYSLVNLHLDHKRPYATRESIEKNRKIRAEIRKTKQIRTPNGIVKAEESPTADAPNDV